MRVAAFPSTVHGGRRRTGWDVFRPGDARQRRRTAHRCPRQAAGRGDPRQSDRARRCRRFSARLFAVDQRGPRAHGAGRGAVARARRRHRRPADRGQACRRPLARGDVKSTALLVSASAWTLGIAARVIHPGETPETILDTCRAPPRPAGDARGDAAGDAADRLAFRARADHRRGARARPRPRRFPLFVRHARRRRAHRRRRRQNISTPMPARSRPSARTPAMPRCRAGPAFRSSSRRCIRATKRSRASACSRSSSPRIIELAQLAKAHDLQFTIDAEEADRLELSLESSARVLGDPSLAGWDGFGLAVQAYQKRASAVIAWIEDAAAATRRRLTVRLVKGAYWDTEIKRAQERGLADYPVFSRKAMTDLCYMACVQPLARGAQRSFSAIRHPQCAHCRQRHRGRRRRRRLRVPAPARHGRGALRGAAAELPDAACRIYAPVGGHRDLLAYLVRRLLENGANSSFVSVAADASVPIEQILRRPQRPHWHRRRLRAIAIFRCRAIFISRPGATPQASSSATARASTGCSRKSAPELHRPTRPRRVIDGIARGGTERKILSPIDGRPVGTVRDADAATARGRDGGSAAGFPDWAATPTEDRAAILERAAESLEAHRGELLALLQNEGGKTLDDALAELREAADYCRYYAAQARSAARRRSRCRDRPARATCCAIAAAARLSASARGIFRSRSFSAR